MGARPLVAHVFHAFWPLRFFFNRVACYREIAELFYANGSCPKLRLPRAINISFKGTAHSFLLISKFTKLSLDYDYFYTRIFPKYIDYYK